MCTPVHSLVPQGARLIPGQLWRCPGRWARSWDYTENTRWDNYCLDWYNCPGVFAWSAEVDMAGDVGGGGRGQVLRIESPARAVTAEDVWNAAIRAGADPARMALSLCHVLGEVSLAEMAAGAEDDPAVVRFTLTTGEEVQYDATFYNPFNSL